MKGIHFGKEEVKLYSQIILSYVQKIPKNPQKNLVLINSAKSQGTTLMHKNHLCLCFEYALQKEIKKTCPFTTESKIIKYE